MTTTTTTTTAHPHNKKNKIALFDSTAMRPPPRPDEPHNCSDFEVQAADGEICCMICGAVNEEATALNQLQTRSELDDKATSIDHHVGNMLYRSQTPQPDYVSRANPGQAMALNDPRGRDAQGKKIRPQLRDAYRAGLFAGKYWHKQKDPITGEEEFKFSRYDMPTLVMVKDVTDKYATFFGLDTVQKSHLASIVTRQFSQIMMSEGPTALALASLLESGLLKGEDRIEAEELWVEVLDKLRVKLITRCNKELMKQARDRKKAQAPSSSSSTTTPTNKIAEVADAAKAALQAGGGGGEEGLSARVESVPAPAAAPQP